MVKIKNTLNISVTVDGNNAQQKLREQTALNGKKVKAVIATTFVGNGAMTPTFLQQCTMTLRDKNNKVVIDDLPLYIFDPRVNANGMIQELDFQNEIDWNQSYITNPNFAATGGTKINVSVVFE